MCCPEGCMQQTHNCQDETDPITLSGVSDFVADYEISKWSNRKKSRLERRPALNASTATGSSDPMVGLPKHLCYISIFFCLGGLNGQHS